VNKNFGDDDGCFRIQRHAGCFISKSNNLNFSLVLKRPGTGPVERHIVSVKQEKKLH